MQSGSSGAPRCPQPDGHSSAISRMSGNAATMSSGVMCASPNDRMPGVSTAHPPSGSGRATVCVDVCRPLPTPLTTPTARFAPGTSWLISVDLPTPECPISADTFVASRSRSAFGSSSDRVTTTTRSSSAYAASSSSGLARSAFVRHSTGVSPPA